MVWARTEDGADQNSESSLAVGTVRRKKRGRPVITWLHGIWNIMKEKHLSEGEWKKRVEWRRGIRTY